MQAALGSMRSEHRELAILSRPLSNQVNTQNHAMRLGRQPATSHKLRRMASAT